MCVGGMGGGGGGYDIKPPAPPAPPAPPPPPETPKAMEAAAPQTAASKRKRSGRDALRIDRTTSSIGSLSGINIPT